MRPMEGCHTAVPRQLRRGRDVRTADNAVAVDTRQVSPALDTVVSRKIHRTSECVTTVVPKLAAAPQAASAVIQPRPRDYGYTDSLPPGSRCLDSPRIDTPEAAVSSMEVAGGSPPAEINISRSPDRLQTEISEMTTKMASGSPPVDIDTCVVPDVLPIAMSVKTVMSDKSMEIDTSDAVVPRMEVTGGSPPAEIDISRSPDVLQRAVSVMAVVSEKWMERFLINLDVLCSDGLAPDDDPARRSSDVGSDGFAIQDPIPTAVSVRTVVTAEWMDRFVLDLVECPSVSRTSEVARTFGPAVSEEYSPVVFAGGGCRCIPPGCRRVRYSSSVWPTVG